MTSGSIPCCNTSRRMSRELAPIAMRIPNSCVRWLTEFATTVYSPIEASNSAIAAKIRKSVP